MLDGVNLTMRRGAIMGLVGESGCGKTTLARSILGILPSNARNDGGSIRFDGVDLATCSARQMRAIRGRRIAMIFQEPMSSLNPCFTAGFQIKEALRIHLGLDAAALVAQLRVDDAALGLVEVVDGEFLQQRQRAGAASVHDCDFP